MQETAQNAFGFAHLWAAGDSVSHTVAIVLALMSMASWYLILADLDAFAHDLHAFFTVGKPFAANSAQIHPMRARAATEAA